MPRLVDYSSRFVFLREAAFQVVLSTGVHALSKRSVARVQGVSASTIQRLVASDADLALLALEEVQDRRRRSKGWAPRNEPVRLRALRTLRELVPDTDARLAEELVWLRLTLAALPSPRDPGAGPGPGSLRERYQIALRGYADPTPVADEPDPTSGPAADRRDELVVQLTKDRTELTAALHAVARALDVPDADREATVRTLELLLDGVRWAVCTGRLPALEAVAELERAVERLLPLRPAQP